MPQGSSNTGIEALCEQRADLLGVRPPRNHRLNFYEKPGKRSGAVPVRIEAGPHAPEPTERGERDGVRKRVEERNGEEVEVVEGEVRSF